MSEQSFTYQEPSSLAASSSSQQAIVERIRRVVLLDFLKHQEPLIRDLAMHSRDMELEGLRKSVFELVEDEWRTWAASESLSQDDRESGVKDSLFTQHFVEKNRESLNELQERAETLASGLKALQQQWSYLDRHSALDDRRQHDILMHLSCSGSLQDRYVLERPLSQGIQSTIYMARSKEDDKRYALKVLDAHSRSALLQRFLIEGSVGKNHLHHERLVRILDFGGFLDPHQHKGQYYIACELLEGSTLSEWIQKYPYSGNAFEPHLDMVAQMIEALDFLHSRGFIHCDVNPYNFFVTEENEIKLLDFGIIESIREVKELTASQAISATQSVGGPRYQAPEQMDSLYGSLSPKTDVYGMGISLFEMFTGRSPFGDEVQSEMDIRIALFQPLRARPSDLTRASMPDWLDALVVRCIEREPAQRPTLRELAVVLRHLRAFRVNFDEMKPMIDQLCRQGFDEDQILQEKITEIRSQFQATLKAEEANLLKTEESEQAEDLVVDRVHKKIEENREQLTALVNEMEPWDPLLQVCPNLLCREPYRQGLQTCPSCSTSWRLGCQDLFVSCSRLSKGVTNSFFAGQCQDPECTSTFNRASKIEAAYNKTVQMALQTNRCDEAAITLLVVGEHLAQSISDKVNFGLYHERCMEALAPARRAIQSSILNDIRNSWKELVERAKGDFGKLHPQVRQAILNEARLYADEGRILDALERLKAFPPKTQDADVKELRDRLHEQLTAQRLEAAHQSLTSAQRRLGQMTETMKTLIPSPPPSVSSRSGVEGWLSGIQQPLQAADEGCHEVQHPLKDSESWNQEAARIVEQAAKPLSTTRKPAEETDADIQRVEGIIRELKEAHKNNQLRGVEEKLLETEEVLRLSDKTFGELKEELSRLEEELNQSRIKLGESRNVLEKADQFFGDVEASLEQAESHIDALEASLDDVKPRWKQTEEEVTSLLDFVQMASLELSELPYESSRQEELLRGLSQVEQQIGQNKRALEAKTAERERLVEEGRLLRQRLKNIHKHFDEQRKVKEKWSSQVADLYTEEDGLRKPLDKRLTLVRRGLVKVQELVEAKEQWMVLERERRSQILRSAISFGTVGSLFGIVAGLALGWWLFARGISLKQPSYLSAGSWGAILGLVMTFSVVWALGRGVFQQRLLVVGGGAVAGAGLSLVLMLMGKVLVGTAAGVLMGSVIGGVLCGGAGALLFVRRLAPWRTLEKAMKFARYGTLLGAFAGASIGSYIGHTHLLEASAYTWIMLVLGSTATCSLLFAAVGYFNKGGAWIDLKNAAEVD